MRIETTRSAVAFRLEHAAGYHRSDADLLAQLVPLALAAIERGEPVAVALRPNRRRAPARASCAGRDRSGWLYSHSAELGCADAT